MHTIQPAQMKPGVTADALQRGNGSGAGSSGAPGADLIRGQALIFWDPERAGQKLDAIDTDQITPSAYCVSESLETLDEK